MTQYPVQAPPHAGAALAMAAPGGTAGDTAPTGPGLALLVQNLNSGSVTVTLPVTPTWDGLAIASRTVSVPGTATAGAAGGWELIPLPSSVYGPLPTAVQYSSAGSVNVAEFRIP